jgi:hypothetical protein
LAQARIPTATAVRVTAPSGSRGSGYAIGMLAADEPKYCELDNDGTRASCSRTLNLAVQWVTLADGQA